MTIAIDKKTCMLAKAPKAGANMRGWLMEPKLDGHRVLARVNLAGEVGLFARSGVDKTANMPHLASVLSELPAGTIIDGEVVALTATGGDWGAVQSVLGSNGDNDGALTFVAFDVLEVMGEDVRKHPLSYRRQLLERVVAHITRDTFRVQVSPQVPYTADAVQALIDAGWEGAIVKDPRSTYRSGRRADTWAKIKATDTEDVVVMGATDGEGKYTGYIGALVFGQYVNGVLTEKGRCSGMTDEQRIGFSNLRALGTLAGTVIEVQHMGIMPSGGWRHPQFKRTRTDKAAADCIDMGGGEAS